MKKFTVLSVIVCMVTVAVLFFAQNGKTKLTGCILSNVEALTNGAETANSSTTCPDYHFVPNEKIYATAATTTYEECTTEGQIKIGEKAVEGQFTVQRKYEIIYQTLNCEPATEGSCCDQRQVGVSIISCKDITPDNNSSSNNRSNKRGNKTRK